MLVRKDAEVQFNQPEQVSTCKEQGTSPTQNETEREEDDIETSPRTRKLPLPKRLKLTPQSTPSTQDFQKESMQKIARYLGTINIKGDKQGSMYINDKIVPESDYVATIRQLSDARMKRSATTCVVLNVIRKYEVPPNIFSAGIMNEIKGPNRSNVESDVNVPAPLKWANF